MNLTDLTEELHHRADEAGRPTSMGAAGGAGSSDRVGAVRHRIQVRHRRRAAAAAAVVVCGFTAAFVVPSVDFNRERTLLPGVGDTIFLDHDGGDPLVTSVVGQPGEQLVSLTFTPSDLDFSVRAVCSDPEAPREQTFEDPGRPFEVLVPEGDQWRGGSVAPQGGQFIGGWCQAGAVPSEPFPNGDGAAAESAAEWRDLGLVAGQPVTLVAQITVDDAYRAPSEEIRLGIAVYERSGARVTGREVRLRELITHEGRDYRLVEHRVGNPADGEGTIELDIPQARSTPFVIVAGAKVRKEAKYSPGEVTLWVEDTRLIDIADWVMSTQALADTDAHRLKLEVTGDAEGTAALAYYAAVE